MNLAASNTTQLGIKDISITSTAGAQTALDQIDISLTDLNLARGRTGALQNRFAKALGNLGVSIESLTAAHSSAMQTSQRNLPS